jgi:hypothetical protein
MKRIISLCVSAACVASLGAAESDAKSAVKGAARKLAEKANYSWSLENKPEGGGQGFQMTLDGQAEKGGFVTLKVTFGQNEREAVRKGEKIAVLQDGEWKLPDDMEEQPARMARRFGEMKLPAAEAEELADKAKDLKAGADGLYSGDLTEAAVKEIFARFRRGNQGPEPKDAKGWVKFWVKDGLLTKYQFNTQATIAMGQDQQEREVSRTTTVEIKDVGTTKMTVPEAAKKKLS